jgi:hypothetical protein
LQQALHRSQAQGLQPEAFGLERAVELEWHGLPARGPPGQEDAHRGLSETSLVWTAVLRSDLNAAGIDLEQTEGIIDVIRTDEASDVAAVLKEQRDGAFKVSLRSKGATDVGAVAGRFGGGGHRFAAGFTSQQGMDATVKALADTLTGGAGPTGDLRPAG